MRFNVNEYNVIYDKYEEGFIGYQKDLIEIYKKYIKQLVNDEQFDGELFLVIDLLKKLIVEYNSFTLLYIFFDNYNDEYKIKTIKGDE